MIYFLYCGYDHRAVGRIAIHEACDLETLQAEAITVADADGVFVLGMMHNFGPVCRMDFIEGLFEHLIDGVLYVPNSDLLDFILEETTPHSIEDRAMLLALCEKQDPKDDLIAIRDADGCVVEWKRFGDMTIQEARKFIEWIQTNQAKADRKLRQARAMMDDKFGPDVVQDAIDNPDGPLPDLD